MAMERDAAVVERPQDERQASSSSESMQQQQQQQYLYSHSGASQRPQQAEVYRGSAQAAPLPSLHSSSAEGPTAMQHYLATTMNGAQLQQPSYNPAVHQYALYHQNGAVQPPPMPSNGQGMMRYPIPPQTSMDSRQMTGARGKKDIKRRTKTGCLTCRKRRIKCDEAQPSCRNCAKSKRECLGYDPIFKQQSGPANIQPAPTNADSPPETKPATTSTAPSFRAPLYSDTVNTLDGASDYQGPPSYTSLDPSLGHEHSFTMARNSYQSSLQAERKVRYIAIDDLFSLNDTPPQYQKREAPPPLSPPQQQELAEFYMYHYAPGLDRLLETTFYTSEGLAHLQSNPELQDFVYQCAEQFKPSADHPAMPNQIRSLEARLVWHLVTMARTSGSSPELAARVDTLENLLTGHFLDPSRIPQPPTSALPEDVFKEKAFWRNLARFVAARDDRPDSNTHRQISDSFGAMRAILGMTENRDVLYSIAIARHIGGRSPDFHPQRHIVATSNDADDEINKLKVAHQFVEIEDQKGTTQVIQRVCSMALRAWALQKQ
ncbi:hypothetical protein LTR86_005653 [Recurvomyces mirabilis]|nr:hypothetical protein LTR86_005653 [Recurvomyces mirabilis]